MCGEEIENVITEYFKNPKAEYAVMIDGEWGSGKTYFLTHSLQRIIENIDNGKEKKRKYAYVSLYGAKSIEEVSKEIVFQCFGRKSKNKVETVDAVIETASNILTASVGALNIDLSKIKDTLAKININNWIICFDDLERCCLPISEILGYMNRLVEHNKCKVIVLANEKEIGKINFNQRLEEKYKVVLAGRKVLFDKDDKSNSSNLDEGIDINNLKAQTKMLFNEDVLYKSIREKVIGLTIKYEPEMGNVYDSIVSDYDDPKFKEYLIKNKGKILKYFDEEECSNLRTLISALGSIRKVYDEMISHKYEPNECFFKILDAFEMYIILFTIYYRNGGRISDLNLRTEIGYVPLRQNLFSNTRGFKFLERYCTTLSFLDDEFTRVVSILRKEYEIEAELLKNSRHRSAESYDKLSSWWEEEDEDVEELIMQLKKEIKQDKYPFNRYQGIVSLLMVLEVNTFVVGDINEVIDDMNKNIEKTNEIVDIEKFSYTFEKNPELQTRYDKYIDKLKLKAGIKNNIIKSTEVLQYLTSDNWASELYEYCNKHFNDFYSRYGFIDLIDTDLIIKKMKEISTKELYLIRDIFRTVYKAANINEFFLNDKNKLEKFRDQIREIGYSGINKPAAKEALLDYLGDIIKRLEKETYA